MVDKQNKIIIFTDGACIGNPGPGGFGVVIINGKNRREFSGGFRLTTNNRMELMAAIEGLKALSSPSSVTLYSDSRYLVDTMNEDKARKWQANGWKRNKKDYALNSDLWHKLIELANYHKISFVWLPGHTGNKENERCDWLSTNIAQSKNLPPDTEYEKPSVPPLPLFG